MRTERMIELIFFQGCPHVDDARDNLRDALAAVGSRAEWSEWDTLSERTPARYRRYPSPTVLVDGRDVMGPGHGSSGTSCRVDGAPPRSAILALLR